MLPEKVHRYLFLFGAFSLGFGVMMGAVPTSVPQIILLANWLLEGRFIEKWQRLKANKLFWVLISVFFWHMIGLVYSSNVNAGLDDIWIKMPVFFMSLIFFSTAPLSQKELRGVLLCFLAGSLCNTLWCLAYSFLLHHNEVGRDASRFMSHIRLGLYLNMAVACCVYFIMTCNKAVQKAGFVVLAFYFLVIMYVLGLASGLSGFFILVFFGGCYIIYSQKAIVKLLSLVMVVTLFALGIRYILQVKHEQLGIHPTKNNTLLKLTENGNGYLHFDTLTQQKENGNYVFINIQLEELKQQWQQDFPEDSFSYDPHPHNLVRYNVLVRYLTSKGLNKDSAGYSKLTAEDKENVRRGIGNYRYPHWNYLHKRVYEMVNEYDEARYRHHVNGHSLTMRYYFWKAAAYIIRHHPLFGVGTGDVQEEMNGAYSVTQSPLQPEWHKRPHNQFLTVTVALGLVGLTVLLISLLYPLVLFKKQLHILYWPFFVLLIASFLVEDTLESQAGLTFYVFFNTLLLSVTWFKGNTVQAVETKIKC